MLARLFFSFNLHTRELLPVLIDGGEVVEALEVAGEALELLLGDEAVAVQVVGLEHRLREDIKSERR